LGCVLANDEVKDGKSERGGYPVTRKKMRQWSLRITEYADRLLEGLNRIDWSDSLKDQQRNWIGRSEGCLLEFNLSQTLHGSGDSEEVALEVFTTRIDTLFGVTFLVVAPEHEFIQQLITNEQRVEMDAYLTYVGSRSDIERQQEKKVTGCFTGSFAIHPFTGKQIPIYTAEYVLAGYGTGAIMAVPADDERDRKFAEKFGLPIIDIVDKSMYPGATIEDKKGKMMNSDFLDGMEVLDAIEAMTQKVEEMGIGKRQVNYKLRDASYSRQRYWGEPFPIRYEVQDEPDSPFVEEHSDDEADIPVALHESELPLALPAVDSFKPTGDGRSPLANNADWVKNNYETDTMPGYAGSSWYYLRYMDPKNPDAFAAKEKLDYWENVDIYFGGAEHAVGHLLYSRFWHKVLFDLGYVSTDEPFKKLVNQGMIQGVSPRLIFVDVADTTYAVSADKVDYSVGTVLINGETKNIERGGTARVNYSLVKIVGGELRLYKTTLDNNKEDFTHLSVYAYPLGQIHKVLLWETDDRGEQYFVLDSEVEKMSKSKYNVVNPDDVIEKYGADCFRMFEMFLGPIEQSKPWDDKGISGVSNFLKKFWRLFYDDKGWRVTDAEPSDAEYKVLHKTIKKIADDIERLNFNTCISGFMIAVNELSSAKTSSRKILEPLVIALAPFAPFISDSLLALLENNGIERTKEELINANYKSVHQREFPTVEQKYLVESTHTYGVSINGKVRDEIVLPLDATEAEARAQVLAREKVKQWTQGAEPKKFIFVKGKIINVVV
jgi:leucyl-tRNA synthetase